eukprot:1156772-Pelagomonas_calceolata.AAC.4
MQHSMQHTPPRLHQQQQETGQQFHLAPVAVIPHVCLRHQFCLASRGTPLMLPSCEDSKLCTDAHGTVLEQTQLGTLHCALPSAG